LPRDANNLLAMLWTWQHGDQAFFAGDKAHVGVLKSLITEESLTVEGKGSNIVQAPNYLHIMMASNEEWVVPADLHDRRFFVLAVGDEHRGDRAYWDALYNELENSGYDAMLHELLSMNISGFNVRSVPQTEGLQEQKQETLDLNYRW
jgi:Mesyanzhinovviridae DNA primase